MILMNGLNNLKRNSMMYYSILSFRYNSWPEECVAVGMIFIDSESGEIKVKLSEIKMKLARKVLPNKMIFNHFKSYAKNFVKAPWTVNALDHSARHQNGLVKITRPSTISTDMDSFDLSFEKWLEENFKIK